MKKIFELLIILLSVNFFTLNIAYCTAQYLEMDNAQYQKAMKKLNEPYNATTKAQLDSMGFSAIKAFDRGDYKTADTYTTKMMMNGAESVNGPDKRKYDPTCPYSTKPEITINGKTLKGNTCIKLSYSYKNKNYDLGYCR